MGDVSTTERLLRAFHGEIEPVHVPMLYHVALVLVALAMVLLPLVYVGLIGVVLWGLYYHAVYSVAIFDGGGGVRGKVLFYIAPLVVGGILVLFMIKPLFARQAKEEIPPQLRPDDEPVLFAFVHRICEIVGSAHPREIRADCQVNASASFRRGLASLFENDLVLTVGMPLVAGLTLRQFAGVLAHEFGHFAQGAGMRLTYVIRSVNRWFARVVYERDVWDQRLDHWARNNDWRVVVILQISRFFVRLTRVILWALMMAGHALSCFMLRQMEFDADRYEARVAGSDCFGRTAHRLQELGVATNRAYRSLRSNWRQGRLPDDFARLVIRGTDSLGDDVRQAIREHADQERTRLLDTHPTDRDRIANAVGERAAGVFRLEEPAVLLFADFDRLSREVSARHYRDLLGPEALGGAKLVASDAIAGDEAAARSSLETLGRYFGEVVADRPVWSPTTDDGPGADPITALADAREEMGRLRDSAMAALSRFKEADERLILAEQAALLVSAGVSFEPDSFRLSSADEDGVLAAANEALKEIEAVEAELSSYEAAAGRRLGTALRLATAETVREAIHGAEGAPDRVDHLLAVLRAVARMETERTKWRRELNGLRILLRSLAGQDIPKRTIEAIVTAAATLRAGLSALRSAGAGVRYPFDHAEPGIDCGVAVAGRNDPPEQDVVAIFNEADAAVDRYFSLRFRVQGELVGLALTVETALITPTVDVPGR